MVNVTLIGHGNIGKEVQVRVNNQKWDLVNIVTPSGVYSENKQKKADADDYLKFLDDTDIVFLSIPTKDDGRIAFEYIDAITKRSIPIVTCEKGALSRYFGQLEDKLSLVGYSATVGGGSGMLPYAIEQMSDSVSAVHAVLNGTMNFILYNVGNGLASGSVVDSAIKLGYAEPLGEGDGIIDVINGEAIGDVPKKIATLCNFFNIFKDDKTRDKFLNTSFKGLNEESYERLMREAGNRRYIVSITKEPMNEEDIIAPLYFEVDGWTISSGFKDVNQNSIYQRLLVPGVFNALLMVKGPNGEYGANVVSGEGAGPGPTVEAMMKDAKRLLNI